GGSGWLAIARGGGEEATVFDEEMGPEGTRERLTPQAEGAACQGRFRARRSRLGERHRRVTSWRGTAQSARARGHRWSRGSRRRPRTPVPAPDAAVQEAAGFARRTSRPKGQLNNKYAVWAGPRRPWRRCPSST